MTERDIQGAGLWLWRGTVLHADRYGKCRPAATVPRFRLPRGFFPAYRELAHHSPLMEAIPADVYAMAPLPVVGRYVFPRQPTSGTGGAVTVDRTYFSPFPVPFTSMTFDRLAMNLTGNGGAGSVTRMGIYQNDAANQDPGTLTLDAGTFVSASGGGSTKTITINQRLVRGWWWIASAAQVGTSPSFALIGPTMYYDGGHDSTPSFLRAWPYATQSGAFASSPSLTTGAVGSMPMMGARISSYEA